MNIVVGSTNPVKIQAVERGLTAIWKEKYLSVTCTGIDASSGVPDQPFGDEETKQGAINRAKNAFAAYQAQNLSPPTFSFGIEGGIVVTGEEMECCAWVVVYDGERFGTARTASFSLPPAISTLVKEGVELGVADDTVFKRVNSKQGSGTVGHLTRGIIDRTQYYEQAVILAMIPFQWPELY
jgi:inosine/xanthosine triphosphatase